MKTKLFSILLTVSLANISLLNASGYDDDILNIFAKIAPRFVLMSSQKKKIKNNIKICILHDEIDKLTVSSLINKMNDNYPNGLKNYNLHLLSIDYKDIEKCKNSELIFMFNSDKEDIDSAVMFSNKYHILTMSYDNELLQNGVNISLFIGRRVLPYINMETIKKNKIELDNILLRVSKIYSGGQK